MGASDPETALAVRLTAQGIPPELVEAALERHQMTGTPVEEALIDVGLPEMRLLEALAAVYGVQYVGSEKLARAKVHPATLRLIPYALANRCCAVPLLLDDNATLTAVAARPLAPGVAAELMRAASANGVHMLVARPKAVRSAINSLYGGVSGISSGMADTIANSGPPTMPDSRSRRFADAAAPTEVQPFFDTHVPSTEPYVGPDIADIPTLEPHSVRSIRAEELLSRDVEVTMTPDRGTYRTRKKTLPSGIDAKPMLPEMAARVIVRGPGQETGGDDVDLLSNALGEDRDSPLPASLRDLDLLDLDDNAFSNLEISDVDTTFVKKSASAGADFPSSSTLPGTSQMPPMRVPTPFELELNLGDLNTTYKNDAGPAERPVEFDVAVATEPEELTSLSLVPPAPSGTPTTRQSNEPTDDKPIELVLLERLVPVLDVQQGRPGHSDGTCQMLERLARELNAPTSDLELRFAGLLHDLGKGPEHTTALSISVTPEDANVARIQHTLPLAIAMGLGFPEASVAAVKHMYERVDGKGFPKGMSGTDVPLLARMLAVAESYVDLTENAQNHLGKKIPHAEALTTLRRHVGTVFDTEIVDALAFAVGHERL